MPNSTAVSMVVLSGNREYTTTEAPLRLVLNFYLAPGQQSKKIKPGPPYKEH